MLKTLWRDSANYSFLDPRCWRSAVVDIRFAIEFYVAKRMHADLVNEVVSGKWAETRMGIVRDKVNYINRVLRKIWRRVFDRE